MDDAWLDAECARLQANNARLEGQVCIGWGASISALVELLGRSRSRSMSNLRRCVEAFSPTITLKRLFDKH